MAAANASLGDLRTWTQHVDVGLNRRSLMFPITPVKVQVVPLLTMKAYKRNVSHPTLTIAIWGECFASGPYRSTTGKETVGPVVNGARLDPEPIWTCRRSEDSIDLARNRAPDRPARSLVTSLSSVCINRMPFRRGIYIFGIAYLGNEANSRAAFAFTFGNNERVRFRAIGLVVCCYKSSSERRERDGAVWHADVSGLRPRYGSPKSHMLLRNRSFIKFPQYTFASWFGRLEIWYTFVSVTAYLRT